MAPWKLLAKTGPAWTMPKTKLNFFLEITKRDHKLSITFILSKYLMFCLIYEWFSDLCDVLLPKPASSGLKRLCYHDSMRFWSGRFRKQHFRSCSVFSFYSSVVKKLKLNKIHITVPWQQYCVLLGEENKNPSYNSPQKPRK